jgi:hypothetical protein
MSLLPLSQHTRTHIQIAGPVPHAPFSVGIRIQHGTYCLACTCRPPTMHCAILVLTQRSDSCRIAAPHHPHYTTHTITALPLTPPSPPHSSCPPLPLPLLSPLPLIPPFPPPPQFYEGTLQNGVSDIERQFTGADLKWPNPSRPMYFLISTGNEEMASTGEG